MNKEISMNKIEQAVAPLKNDAIKRAEEKGQAMIANHLENLEKAGWDLNVVAPRPHTMMDRKSYKEKMALHNMIRQLTSSNTPTRRINDPDIRIRNRQAEQRLLDQIKQDAAFDYEKFVAKLIKKIGDVDDATLTGNHVWGYSLLTVQKGNQTEYWRTQQIINVSVLGKVFNQWPTRQVK
jgi:hypothetical protein